MLPAQVPERGHGLGELHVPVDVVRQVGEVQAEVGLGLGPLLWVVEDVVALFLVVDSAVLQDEADVLSQLYVQAKKSFFQTSALVKLVLSTLTPLMFQ